jgi:hypothetical protein
MMEAFDQRSDEAQGGQEEPIRRGNACSPATAAAGALPALRMYLEQTFPPELQGKADDPLPMERVFRATRRGGRLYIKAVIRSLPGREPRVEFEERLVRLTATGGRLFDLEAAADGGMWGLMEEDLALREIFQRLRDFPFFLGL